MLALSDVKAAAQRLKGVAVTTPLLENALLNERAGGRILLKAEGLQRTGSFKFRGAYNRLAQLSPEERCAGVVAWSSGNHAQAVAAAAKLLGVSAAIVMPRDAPALKIANTRAYGAEVILYDRYRESREEIAAAIATARGAVPVAPYDDHRIMAGQGTVGLEMIDQARAMSAGLDAVLIPCSGGGLAAGAATAIKALSPGTQVYSVEPERLDDTARSLASGDRMSNDPAARSICDALMAPTPGRLTFPVNQKLLKGGLTVSDDEVRAAMAYAFRVLKLVVEPGGAVALAACLNGKIESRDRTIGIVLSGANVDADLFSAIIR